MRLEKMKAENGYIVSLWLTTLHVPKLAGGDGE